MELQRLRTVSESNCEGHLLITEAHLFVGWLPLVIRKHDRLQHEVALVEEGAANLPASVAHHPALHYSPCHPGSCADLLASIRGPAAHTDLLSLTPPDSARRATVTIHPQHDWASLPRADFPAGPLNSEKSLNPPARLHPLPAGFTVHHHHLLLLLLATIPLYLTLPALLHKLGVPAAET